MTRLVLVRHGETDWNREGRYQGQIDTSLNGAGRTQAAQLAARFAGDVFDAVYSSDLKRAYETAQMIAGAQKVQPDPRLREPHYGVFQGLTFAEMQAQYPQAFAAWQINHLCHTPPGGESAAQIAARIRAFLDAVRAQGYGGRVLVVAHGELLQVLLCVALGLPPSQYWQFDLGGNVSVSEIGLDARGPVLLRLNDTCHLHGC